jgi:enamine deaminase RidA (YjgF/YER057c/UK114 family)
MVGGGDVKAETRRVLANLQAALPKGSLVEIGCIAVLP